MTPAELHGALTRWAQAEWNRLHIVIDPARDIQRLLRDHLTQRIGPGVDGAALPGDTRIASRPLFTPGPVIEWTCFPGWLSYGIDYSAPVLSLNTPLATYFSGSGTTIPGSDPARQEYLIGLSESHPTAVCNTTVPMPTWTDELPVLDDDNAYPWPLTTIVPVGTDALIYSSTGLLRAAVQAWAGAGKVITDLFTDAGWSVSGSLRGYGLLSSPTDPGVPPTYWLVEIAATGIVAKPLAVNALFTCAAGWLADEALSVPSDQLALSYILRALTAVKVDGVPVSVTLADAAAMAPVYADGGPFIADWQFSDRHTKAVCVLGGLDEITDSGYTVECFATKRVEIDIEWVDGAPSAATTTMSAAVQWRPLWTLHNGVYDDGSEVTKLAVNNTNHPDCWPLFAIIADVHLFYNSSGEIDGVQYHPYASAGLVDGKQTPGSNEPYALASGVSKTWHSAGMSKSLGGYARVNTTPTPIYNGTGTTIERAWTMGSVGEFYPLLLAADYPLTLVTNGINQWSTLNYTQSSPGTGAQSELAGATATPPAYIMAYRAQVQGGLTEGFEERITWSGAVASQGCYIGADPLFFWMVDRRHYNYKRTQRSSYESQSGQYGYLATGIRGKWVIRSRGNIYTTYYGSSLTPTWVAWNNSGQNGVSFSFQQATSGVGITVVDTSNIYTNDITLVTAFETIRESTDQEHWACLDVALSEPIECSVSGLASVNGSLLYQMYPAADRESNDGVTGGPLTESHIMPVGGI